MLVLMAVLLSACGGDAPEEPEAAPTDEPPTVAPEAEATADALPPTQTLTPTETADLPPTIPPERPTLPPTWTPTVTLAPTETPDMAEATDEAGAQIVVTTPTRTPVFQPTQPPSCRDFAVDSQATIRNFFLGETPVVAWLPVDEAALYRVTVIDETDTELYEVLVDGNETSIPAETFPQAGFYAWQVIPLNALGLDLCLQRGDMLIVDD